MPTGQGLPSVREHADKVISDLIAKGNIAPDADAAKLAAGIPTFSKGTAALDPNTGQPIAATPDMPLFTEGDGIKIPEGVASAEAVGVAGSGKTAEELLAEHRQRVAEGASDNGAGGPIAAAAPAAGESPPPPPAAQAAGAAAAEAAAEAVADRFAEYDEFELDDPNLEMKVPVRVPKQFSQSVRRGYGLRSQYDRAISYLKNAEPTLGPLIESGRLNPLLPLIQAALDDPQGFGEYVVRGFERKQKGLPLIEQARQEIAAAAASAVAPQYDNAGALIEDPFMAEQLRPVLSQISETNQRITRYEQERQADQQRQAQQQAENQRMIREMQAAHADLERIYPGQANTAFGAEDPFWKKAVKYAQEAGYVQAYGLRAGIVFGAQQAVALEQERIAATASPAAAALAAGERNLELARQQAAAASRAVGSGAPTQAVQPPRPVAPTPRRADGTLKQPGEFLREQQQYLAAVG